MEESKLAIKARLIELLGAASKVTDCKDDHLSKMSYGNRGRLIAYPEDDQDVVQILKFAHHHRLTVIPEGGGTKRGMGGAIAEADLLLSMSRMRGIVEHAASDLVMAVKAGTPLFEIQQELANQGQFLPLDPPFPEQSTIGGIIAGNASGPKRLRYGSARDLVIGMRVVIPDREIMRFGAKVVKNVAGYDINKLFVGSMGTLGVITEVFLKLKPLPARQSLLILESQDDGREIEAFSRLIMDSLMEPVALEMLNPALNHQLGGNRNFALAVCFEDVEKAVEAQEKWVRQHLGNLRETRIMRDEEAADWWRQFAICGTRDYSLKAGVPLTNVAAMLRFAEAEAQHSDLEILSHGGTGLGIVRIHFEGQEAEQTNSFVQTLRSYAAQVDGYVVLEKAPLAVRTTENVWGEPIAVRNLMEGIKAKFDPHRILNPSRFVGGI